MADFCKQCALDTFGEDIGDLAGISTPEHTASGMFPVVICEGCGPVQVDHTGTRVPATTTPPSVPMTMRHRPPGSLALRVLKDDLAHAHDPDPDQR